MLLLKAGKKGGGGLNLRSVEQESKKSKLRLVPLSSFGITFCNSRNSCLHSSGPSALLQFHFDLELTGHAEGL